jgi:predicted  nucleic acid-binding Zn-ribbon protein
VGPVFDFLRRKTKPGHADPLVAFDAALESLERQASAVRRSAATLLALRSGLQRDAERARAQLEDLARRLALASDRRDAQAARALGRDEGEARRKLQATEQALAHTDDHARLLLSAGEALGRERVALEEERVSARARLSTGLVVSEALRHRAAEFDRLMKLDAARDEVERAQALAELYREDLETEPQPPR